MSKAKEQRIGAVLAALQRTGSATVAGLGAELGVAEMTIRRDLERLEEDGVITRFHGGARLVSGSSFEPPLATRARSSAVEKRAIARTIADLVFDGETVVIDGGSTGIAIAEALAGRSITVCPLSLRVAWAFERSTTVSLLLPPGRARRGELSLSGPETIEYLRRHRFDRYLMTASTFAITSGFGEWDVDDAGTKRAAIDSADVVTAGVDSSKFGRTAFVSICDIDRPDQLVVDDQLAEERRTALREVARELVIAE